MFNTLRLLCMLIKYLMLKICSYIFAWIQAAFWIFNGTAAKVTVNQSSPEMYHYSGHRLKVRYNFFLDNTFGVELKNFWLQHEDFVHPTYIFKDEVTLLTVTETLAVFVERRSSAIQPHSLGFSFFNNGQMADVDKVITMPLWSLNKVMESRRYSDGRRHSDTPVIFIHNTGRCGSTLLTNIFKHTERCICFSEPRVIHMAGKYIYEKKWDVKQGKRIFFNIVQALCKQQQEFGNDVLAYVIKPASFFILPIETYFELVPNVLHLFLYRNLVNTSQSFKRLTEAVPLYMLRQLILNAGFPSVAAALMKYCDHAYQHIYGWKPKTCIGLEYGYRLASIRVQQYLQCRNRNLTIHGIRYEDIKDNPRMVISKLLVTVGLPDSLTTLAFEATRYDSQKSTAISQEQIHRNKLQQPSQAFLDAVKEESMQLGIPPPEDCTTDFKLPGTI